MQDRRVEVAISFLGSSQLSVQEWLHLLGILHRLKNTSTLILLFKLQGQSIMNKYKVTGAVDQDLG